MPTIVTAPDDPRFLKFANDPRFVTSPGIAVAQGASSLQGGLGATALSANGGPLATGQLTLQDYLNMTGRTQLANGSTQGESIWYNSTAFHAVLCSSLERAYVAAGGRFGAYDLSAPTTGDQNSGGAVPHTGYTFHPEYKSYKIAERAALLYNCPWAITEYKFFQDNAFVAGNESAILHEGPGGS